jgi:molybdopterin-guanine dinucleotide biosynthesis protein A
MDFSAVILAGGRSSRMGRDKAWLEFHGRPLIRHQIDTVRACRPVTVYIAARSSNEYAGLDCQVLADNFPDSGPLAGLESALEAMSSSLLLVLAIDMPRLTTRTICRLHGMCDNHTGVVPTLEERPEPLAAFYPKAAHRAVREFLGSGLKGARRFVEMCTTLRLVRLHPLPASTFQEFGNWNSPNDLPASS